MGRGRAGPTPSIFCLRKSKHARIKVENKNSSPGALKQNVRRRACVRASPATQAIAELYRRHAREVELASTSLDCLQSAFSLKIRLVLISSSAIGNHDPVITIRD